MWRGERMCVHVNEERKREVGMMECGEGRWIRRGEVSVKSG